MATFLLKQIQAELKRNSNTAAKEAHQYFVPGQQKVYGVRNTVLQTMAGKYKAGGFELVDELWLAGSLEEKTLALKIMGKIAKKDPDLSLKMIQNFAKKIDNWAICDAMGMQALKQILPSHQEEIFTLAKKYNSSKDFWQRRLSLVLVEWYTRKKECHTEILKLVKNLEQDEEYYVKKAVDWIKRNLKKEK